ncbi:hypothetical protein C5167_005419 [Papaver somniferum]|uniref:Uncharacterized protein n=1 Tax=Papaver somniferum TaxID=3469 RepID=A0A4Y7JC66_PAPSO|nr:hypothetical protein C5167_005419 [Papaver somniferum]
MTSSRGSLSTSSRSSSPNFVNVSAINENEVKFKITLCHSALNDNRAALVEVSSQPLFVHFFRISHLHWQLVPSAEGQSLADEYSRSAQYLAYFGGKVGLRSVKSSYLNTYGFVSSLLLLLTGSVHNLYEHGKLVDKENRTTEGPVTIGVTSGASTQDKVIFLTANLVLFSRVPYAMNLNLKWHHSMAIRKDAMKLVIYGWIGRYIMSLCPAAAKETRYLVDVS